MANCLLEICACTYNSVEAAVRGGAARVELCSALGEGGLTPSLGLIKATCRQEKIKTHVLIRPRGGDFLYTKAEQSIMVDDIKAAADLGADGIVVGALTADGRVDNEAMSRFIAAADGLPVTFHRAFDVCKDPVDALEDIIGLGCRHLLTSGQATTAVQGILLLRQLVKQSANRLIVMAGCGVNASNAAKIIQQTGVCELHASASASVVSRMTFRRTQVTMGKADADEYAIRETSASLVRDLLTAIEKA